ncbi:MAG TPA: hypothetical protein VKB58_09790 [Terriglobales bacterium]|nr:hypothetical protein [Terriglobales bacterium]
MKRTIHTLRKAAVRASLLGLLMFSACSLCWAEPKTCGANGPETLNPYGDLQNNYKTDLVVMGQCDVNGTPTTGDTLLYVFHNVNVIGGGSLIFHDDHSIDFYAESILVQGTFAGMPPNATLLPGKLIAVSTTMGYRPQISQGSGALPFKKNLTFHLWGAPNDLGIPCVGNPQPEGSPCGIPDPLWKANTLMADDLAMNPPPPPPLPKNDSKNPCKSVTGYKVVLPSDDCFYQYEVQGQADGGGVTYFGHKVLAVSFGGVLQLFGSESVSYLQQGQTCMPKVPGTECNPAFTGTSWVRLVAVDPTDNKKITLSKAVDWKAGDHIVVTPTDYLPSHAEVRTLAQDANNGPNIVLTSAFTYEHRTTTYSLSDLPAGIGPVNDPNTDVMNAVETRAAVGLLDRNIRIVSEGDLPSKPFSVDPGNPDNYFGGHTIVRQGFAGYQVQGVEFYQLGQGGAKGRYSVHFHMVRRVPQPVATGADPTPEPLNYLKDCSIWDSMTRWVTLHATEGMYLARNVGYASIGHGFYLEDATEINNKIYANLGVLARAAIVDTVHNPRQVPGILADNQPVDPSLHNMDYMPFRSDYNHPSVFWITNGWNDFEYNFAAGAATCGACYWWLPTGVSGPSQYQYWDGYASQQIVQNPPSYGPTNYNRAGITPLDKFVGNSCVAATSSFQMNGQTAECLGMTPSGTDKLSAVTSTAPPGPPGNNLPNQPFNVFYPVVAELHNPTLCTAKDNNCAVNLDPCDGGDFFGTCAVTILDHYTTSFNYAQTNFAAVWLRKGWDLVSNSAVTDAQSGGLNFVTGGGYTRADVSLGEWLVARNTVLIGHTQGDEKGNYTNPYAEDVGPFNEDTAALGLSCDNTSSQARNYCAYGDGGVSFNLPTYPGQKLLNIYDGPSHQANNAYIAINQSKISDCSASSGGDCRNSKVPLAWNLGVLQAPKEQASYCYLPNAAIGWKQPNGFYYPPAFHSRNLWFKNVDIRHFVVEPLFEPVRPGQYDPFIQDQVGVNNRYCTHSVDMFSKSFNNIDRQTVLNDDDGTLTGLLGKQGGTTRPSISINEDDYFNAPETKPECLSDVGVLPSSPPSLKGTARTSPYEWLSTAMIADCAITQRGDYRCFNPADLEMKWATNCGTNTCRGVPLYREYLTDKENDNNTRPQIRMMGQGNGQRSTLSINHGAYYIDTTQNCTSQGGCPKCVEIDPNNKNHCLKFDPANIWNPTIFLGGHTYYVYLIYATATTKQSYDIYAPDSSLGELNVQSVKVDPNSYSTTPVTGSSWATASYNNPILHVDVDLTAFGDAFKKSKLAFCRPKSYCTQKADGSCGCKDPNGCNDADCAWGPSDIDCPTDNNNPNVMNCFGFSFVMPQNYHAPATPLPPPNDLFKTYTQGDPYFNDVKFANGMSFPNDVCKYPPQ